MSMRLSACAALAAFSFLATAVPAQAQDRVVPANLQWKEIVPGAHFAAAHGDWEKEGHGKYVRFVKGVQVPLHRHTNAYHGVAISGRLVNVFEAGRKVEVAPGDYFHMAAMRAHAHECLSDGGCLFYTYGDRPWDFVPYEAAAPAAGGNERGHR